MVACEGSWSRVNNQSDSKIENHIHSISRKIIFILTFLQYVSNRVAVVDNRVGGVVCLDNLVVGLLGPVAKQRSLLSANYGEWEKIGEINI